MFQQEVNVKIFFRRHLSFWTSAGRKSQKKAISRGILPGFRILISAGLQPIKYTPRWTFSLRGRGKPKEYINWVVWAINGYRLLEKSCNYVVQIGSLYQKMARLSLLRGLICQVSKGVNLQKCQEILQYAYNLCSTYLLTTRRKGGAPSGFSKLNFFATNYTYIVQSYILQIFNFEVSSVFLKLAHSLEIQK